MEEPKKLQWEEDANSYCNLLQELGTKIIDTIASFGQYSNEESAKNPLCESLLMDRFVTVFCKGISEIPPTVRVGIFYALYTFLKFNILVDSMELESVIKGTSLDQNNLDTAIKNLPEDTKIPTTISLSITFSNIINLIRSTGVNLDEYINKTLIKSIQLAADDKAFTIKDLDEIVEEVFGVTFSKTTKDDEPQTPSVKPDDYLKCIN
jgi:hypothetical protein